nr:galectin-4-like [Rhipicephalus microplus]
MEDNVKHILEQADVTGGLHYKNPPVPYACPLPVSLTVGSQIYIQGLVPEVSVRFSVNLQRGTGEADPVQLHINPRFEPEGPVVVRNSREGKSWGREEREGTSPFAKGRPFLLVITATTPGYELAVNGLPFATFDYRQGLALADITHLCIHGDVILRSVHIPVPEMPKCVRCPLPEPAKIGDVFTLRGQISPWAEKFVLNLATGPGTEDDLALHLNPRFGEGALIRNCRRGGKWGDEEREGDFPLAPGRAFELRVDALEDAFRVTVDGNTLCDFGHRMPLKKVKYLVAEGDLVVDDVRVESDDVEKLRELADNWSLYMPPEPPQQVLQVGDVVPELMSEAMTYYEPKLQMDSPAKPLCQRLPEVMAPGRVVIVSGVVEPKPYRFHVNLQTDVGDTADMGLHLNPRFDTKPRGVVLNSRDRDQWQQEVQVPGNKFPFTEGSPFEIQIHCQEDKFRVLVNGTFLADFPHRIDCSRIDYVCVDGSVILDRIVFA